MFRQDDYFACNDYPCVRLGNNRLIKSCHLLLRDMTDYTLLLDQSCFYDVHDVTGKHEPDFYEKIVTVCMIPAVLCSSILKVSTSGTSFLFFLEMFRIVHDRAVERTVCSVLMMSNLTELKELFSEKVQDVSLSVVNVAKCFRHHKTLEKELDLHG